MPLIYGYDQQVAAWVWRQIPELSTLAPAPDIRAIGITRDQALIGGVVFSDYVPLHGGGNIHITIAGHSGWLSRKVLRAVFGHVFSQYKCNRATCIVGYKNKKSRELALRLGFKEEGKIRGAYGPKRDGILYGLLKEECIWNG